tara:strand:- start:477 stop:830 length:354 start_codon:yes stop_codon:yes gene_type:complete
MPNFKKNKSAFMMKGKSPMMKALVGKQGNLPVDLQKEILAAPTKMYGKAAPIKNKFTNWLAGITGKQEEQNKITNWHMMKGSDREIYKNKFDAREKARAKNKKSAAPKNYKKGYYGA